MKRAIFDTAGKLDLYFRIARTGSKAFTFQEVNGDPYSLDDADLQLNIKLSKSASVYVIQLTEGGGLTIVDNVLTIDVDEIITDIPANLYFWELYDDTSKRTWLHGNAHFINGDPVEGNESTEVTVRLNPDIVTVVISNGTATITEIDGGIL